ncbi:hypothetical protein CRUP_007556 [Coryphaenoides rupestris]|nr:hypothetical protein CRUP_007556 [Coryphaenoides rupestris]
MVQHASEQALLQVALQWLRRRPQERLAHGRLLLSHVRLALIASEELAGPVGGRGAGGVDGRLYVAESGLPLEMHAFSRHAGVRPAGGAVDQGARPARADGGGRGVCVHPETPPPLSPHRPPPRRRRGSRKKSGGVRRQWKDPPPDLKRTRLRFF